jgi:hypothetical protein
MNTGRFQGKKPPGFLRAAVTQTAGLFAAGGSCRAARAGRAAVRVRGHARINRHGDGGGNQQCDQNNFSFHGILNLILESG